MALKIDESISVGNIISAVTMVVAIGIAFWRVTIRLAKMDMKLNMIWRWYKKEHKIDSDE